MTMKMKIILSSIIMLFALNRSYASTPQSNFDNKQVQELNNLLSIIKSNYVYEVDNEKLIRAAMKGIVSSLDPHSSLLEKEEEARLKEITKGEFGGIGVVITKTDSGDIIVVKSIEDTPADKAGVMTGDIINIINDKSTKGMNIDEITKLIKGKPNTKIDIVFIRDDKKIKKILTREIIETNPVTGELLADGIAYIKISGFNNSTKNKVSEKYNILKKKNNNKLKGLILDLRDNPGGTLDAAISISDLFIKNGEIVSMRERNNENVMSYHANNNDITNGLPLVILQNESSASASEIVSGAIKDHKRGIILGTRSFGKGTVQRIISVGDDNPFQLKLTTALYYTPSGISIQGVGIEPNIKVLPAEINYISNENTIRESEIEGAIKNPQQSSYRQINGDSDTIKDDKLIQLEKDYQIQQAANLLKSIDTLKLTNLDKK